VTYNSGTDTTTVAKHRAFDSFGNVTTDSAGCHGRVARAEAEVSLPLLNQPQAATRLRRRAAAVVH
jgi:hypothetical protein